MLTAAQIIRVFNMKPLNGEGGFFVESYRAQEVIPNSALPQRYTVAKSFSTAIYYLLTPDTQSLIHRLPTDEIFHFYLGDPVNMLQLYPDGTGKILTLGHNLIDDHHVQVIVQKNVWQGSFLIKGGRFALMGTTMAPGFDLSDYEGGERERLIKSHPQYKDLITKLTL